MPGLVGRTRTNLPCCTRLTTPHGWSVRPARSKDCAGQCYDARFLAAGGADVGGNYVSIPFLPFYDAADRKAVPMLAQFVKYTGKSDLSSGAAYAWAAGIALRDAVNAAVNLSRNGW